MNIEKDFKKKLTKKDYITYLLNKNMVLLLSPIIILALLVAIVFSIINEGFTASTIIYFLPIALFVWSYIRMNKIINQTIKAQDQLQELKVILNDNEYQDITNGEKNSLSYDKAYCYKETKKYFYLFVDKYNALILPKREFDEKELHQIKTAFNKKIKKQALYDLSSYLVIVIMAVLIFLIVYNIIIQ